MKGSVYKIYCKDSSITEFYVGSSCDFHQRKRKHKSSCNNPKDKQYNYKVYRYIRNNGGYDNWDFEILLETEVENNKELKLKYEAKYQLDLKPELNVIQEGRTPKEYYEDHKEEIKQYYEDHKKEIREYQKEYNENHKEEQKQYYEKNKEQILQKAKEKYECECGSTIRKSDKTTHQKSKKHQNYLSSLSS
jgi:hypothetical protein